MIHYDYYGYYYDYDYYYLVCDNKFQRDHLKGDNYCLASHFHFLIEMRKWELIGAGANMGRLTCLLPIIMRKTGLHAINHTRTINATKAPILGKDRLISASLIGTVNHARASA